MKNILIVSVPSFSHMNGVAVDSLHIRTVESMSHKVGIRCISHHPFMTGHFPPAQASRAGVVTQKYSSISTTWSCPLHAGWEVATGKICDISCMIEETGSGSEEMSPDRIEGAKHFQRHIGKLTQTFGQVCMVLHTILHMKSDKSS